MTDIYIHLGNDDYRKRFDAVQEGRSQKYYVNIPDGFLLVSYNEPVALVYNKGPIAFETTANFSRTTSGHINSFLFQFAFDKTIIAVEQDFFYNLLNGTAAPIEETFEEHLQE